ncbi:MAG: hypothetical protein ACBR50_02020 [Microcoleus sp.]
MMTFHDLRPQTRSLTWITNYSGRLRCDRSKQLDKKQGDSHG